MRVALPVAASIVAVLAFGYLIGEDPAKRFADRCLEVGGAVVEGTHRILQPNPTESAGDGIPYSYPARYCVVEDAPAFWEPRGPIEPGWSPDPA